MTDLEQLKKACEHATHNLDVGSSHQQMEYKRIRTECMILQTEALQCIADAICSPDKYGLTGSAAIQNAIKRGIKEGR